MLKRLAFPAPAENSPRDTVSDVRFSPQGDRLLALRDDGTVGIYQRRRNGASNGSSTDTTHPPLAY
jgi:hypothetical protein